MKYSFFLFGLIVICFGCDQEVSTTYPQYSKTVLTEPQLFAPGVISTELNEFELGLSPDGYTAYFSRRKEGEKQQVFVSQFDGDRWSEAVLADFSTDRDETVCITPDGSTLYFGSERPIPGRPSLGGFDMNVWQLTKDENGKWTDPQPLSAPINEVQIEGENWPSSNNNFFFTNNGEQFYYTTMKRGDHAIRLYTTTKTAQGFSAPERIDGFFENDSTWVYSAVLSPDDKYLVFNSYGAPGGAGGEDLYVAKRTESSWTKAKALEMLNTKNEETSPRFSRDGKYFFFTSAENLGNYEYGPWNIYFMDTSALQLDSMFE
jgi:Tol biopolymer transport system component